MAGEIATINIDKKTIEGIVERQMQAAIVAQLDGTKDILLSRTIDYMLKTKVNSDGKEASYGGEDLVTYLCKKRIREIAEVALNKFMETQQPAIEAQLVKELTRNRTQFAKMAVTAMQDTFKNQFKWAVKVDIGPQQQKEY